MRLVSSLWFFLWRRRVYGGNGKTSPIRMCPSRLSCRFAWQAWHFVTFQTCLITCRKYQNWRKSRAKCCLFFAPTCLISVYGGSSALHTLHFTLHTPQFTLPDSTLFTLHFTLHTLHFALYTPHFTLCTLHSSLLI